MQRTKWLVFLSLDNETIRLDQIAMKWGIPENILTIKGNLHYLKYTLTYLKHLKS